MCKVCKIVLEFFSPTYILYAANSTVKQRTSVLKHYDTYLCILILLLSLNFIIIHDTS